MLHNASFDTNINTLQITHNNILLNSNVIINKNLDVKQNINKMIH